MAATVHNLQLWLPLFGLSLLCQVSSLLFVDSLDQLGFCLFFLLMMWSRPRSDVRRDLGRDICQHIACHSLDVLIFSASKYDQ